MPPGPAGISLRLALSRLSHHPCQGGVPAVSGSLHGGLIRDQDEAGCAIAVRPALEFDRSIEDVVDALDDDGALDALDAQDGFDPEEVVGVADPDAPKPGVEGAPAQRAV